MEGQGGSGMGNVEGHGEVQGGGYESGRGSDNGTMNDASNESPQLALKALTEDRVYQCQERLRNESNDSPEPPKPPRQPRDNAIS